MQAHHKLGEVAQIESGGTPDTKNLKFWDGDILWLTPKELSGDRVYEIYDTERKITGLGLENSSAKLLPKGSVLFSSRAPIGYVAIAGVPLATNQGFKNFICDSKVLDNRYLYYFLKSKTKYLQSLGRGATFGEISRSILSKVEIPLPPRTIQQEIVERLDAIRTAQESNEKQIVLTEELFQSLLQEEFIEKREIMAIKKLSEILEDISSGFASRPVVDGIGQLRPNNIDLNGSLNFESIKFVSQNSARIENYFLRRRDILFNNTNSVELVGKTTYIDRDYDYVFSNHMTRLRLKTNIADSYFVAIYLQYLFTKGKYRYLCTPWVNQAAVNTNTLKNLKIPLPSLDDQHRIVAKLSAVQDYKKKLLEQKTKLKELFDSVLHRSMRGDL